jgi:phosphate-selective porin
MHCPIQQLVQPAIVATIVVTVYAAPATLPYQAPASAPTQTAPPATPAEAEPEQARAPGPEFGLERRPSFRFGDLLRVDLRLKLQGDLRRSYAGARERADLSVFELHRRRVGVSGTLLRRIEFEVERELTTPSLTAAEIASELNAATPWKDVYVDFSYFRVARVRGGRFKIPFGLDALTSATQNDFVYRSLGAEYLAPSRDVGIMVHGRFFERALRYWGGAFRHDGDNAASKTGQPGDRTLAARVAARPLGRVNRTLFGGLEAATAFTASMVRDDSFRPNGLRARTVVSEDVFFEPVYVSGRRWRWEADVDWTGGPMSLRAEYTRVTDDRLAQGIGGDDLADARYRAWYVSGSCLLTGEAKTRPVVPTRGIISGGAGALEVAARVERIWYDSVGAAAERPLAGPRAHNILQNGGRVVTLGINWFPNRWVTVQVNAIRERIEDAARSPVPLGAAFWSEVVRFQLAF